MSNKTEAIKGQAKIVRDGVVKNFTELHKVLKKRYPDQQAITQAMKDNPKIVAKDMALLIVHGRALTQLNQATGTNDTIVRNQAKK